MSPLLTGMQSPTSWFMTTRELRAARSYAAYRVALNKWIPGVTIPHDEAVAEYIRLSEIEEWLVRSQLGKPARYVR